MRIDRVGLLADDRPVEHEPECLDPRAHKIGLRLPMLARDDERWPATILLSLDAVATLKEGAGGPIIVHGSAADRDAVKLRVVEHTTYDNGIQMQVLDVVR